MDRISNLPNELIYHIGSFLSAKEVAFTMVLSKRWRNMFNIVRNLGFDQGDNFTDFVNSVLALPVNSRIGNFYLHFYEIEPAQYDLINRCLRHALKRGVLVLGVEINARKGYSLPLEIFTCETVVDLTLGPHFSINFLPEDAYLPALKTLVLDSIWFNEFDDGCAFNALLSASPVLEELFIYGAEFECWDWSFTVSSPTLERLIKQREKWEFYGVDSDDDSDNFDTDAYDFLRLTLDTPSLTYLNYSDYVPKEYQTVNLNSLVEAKLHLRSDSDELWGHMGEKHADDFDPMNLFNGLKNVEILDLSMETMEIIDDFRKAMPVFENLRRLSFYLPNNCWSSVKTLVKKSPNLKALIIKDYLHFCIPPPNGKNGSVCKCVSKYSFLSSYPVEVLKIYRYRGNIGELEQMKHFLEKLSCLRIVNVRAQVTDDKRLQVKEDLRKLLIKTSSNCKIQVEF